MGGLDRELADPHGDPLAQVPGGLIATAAATVFYFASRKLLMLIKRPVLFGLLYGVVVYAFMNFVVLPLSRVQPRPMTFTGFSIGLLTIMFCVGLPIALIMRRFSQ